MPHTLFISDLHLHPQDPRVTQRFVQFMKNEARQAEALYIIGDLFEAWVGDDDQTPFHQQIIQELKSLHQAGVATYFIHGNRDFLIGRRFAKQTGITLLPDPCVIDIYGKKILLSHGDLLCTHDRRHQRFRSFVFNPLCQKLFLTIPLFFRHRIARKIRNQSGQHNQGAPHYIMDVASVAVEALMRQHNVNLLIHGHTHRPAIHKMGDKERVVLGAWHDNADYVHMNANAKYQLAMIE